MKHYLIPAAYLAAINLVTFVLYGIDKRRAKKGLRRIRERSLLLLAALGGAVGALAAMRCFRHKTLHRKFTIGVPLLLALHILIAAAALYFTYLY